MYKLNVHIQNVMLVKVDLILERFVFTHFIESNVVWTQICVLF